MFEKIIDSFFSKKAKKLFVYNAKILILAIAVIMIWRWVWNFLDHYLLPDDFVISNIISIIVWIVLIFIINEKDLDALWVWE